MARLGNAAPRALPTSRIWNSGSSLEKHVALMKRQVKRSMDDPETIQLANRIVSNRYDYVVDPQTNKQVVAVRGWGDYYRAPTTPACKARDTACEIVKLWDFAVLNLRYTYDPADTDTFRTVKESLSGGGVDCDDYVIFFAAMLGAIGFTSVGARVISEDGNAWGHVYTLVGCPHASPQRWIALDPTVQGVQPGWEYPSPKARRDFELLG
jgi:hypothetical protein